MHCALVLASHGTHAPASHACARCTQTPPPLTHCVAALDYTFPWDRLIQRFKFQGEVAWAPLFAQLMADAPGAATVLDSADWWLPVPLSAHRLGDRGYNQSWELLKAVARRHMQSAHQDTHQDLSAHVDQRPTAPRRSGIPRRAHGDWLLKLADTPDQHHLDRRTRQANLQSVFAVAPHAHALLTRTTVLLVDDILTTGATLHAVAHALKLAGVTQVNALVLARTPLAEP